jgi:protein O-GlcNAc transferase
VLTCAGDSFASRVAASLLIRVNLPQFIAKNLADYEQKALHFLQNPSQLKIQAKTSALFDTAQFARDVEQQYLNIHSKLP